MLNLIFPENWSFFKSQFAVAQVYFQDNYHLISITHTFLKLQFKVFIFFFKMAFFNENLRYSLQKYISYSSCFPYRVKFSDSLLNFCKTK